MGKNALVYAALVPSLMFLYFMSTIYFNPREDDLR
jgi:hypothetical protein